jgi:predicted  nucleic acid-binding Zn-ribbon protein
MIERCTDPETTQGFDDDPGQDTLVLLYEEIARLEAELAAHDAAADLAHEPERVDPTAPLGNDPKMEERVEELTTELAARDEAMDLLLEQARLFEEAALAQRSEWEHLYQWVEEVERRIEGKDTHDSSLAAELQAERGRSEALRLALETDRRSAQVQRAALERELEHLSSRLKGSPDAHRLDAAIAEENVRLLSACAALEHAAAAAPQGEDLQERLATCQRQIDAGNTELRRVEDDRQRERNEYEALLATLRSQIARLSVERTVEAPTPAAPAQLAALAADERIRAFRQHLKDLHQREEDERATRRGLANRLSRLWHRTSTS